MLAGFLFAGQTSIAVEKVEKKKSATTQPKPAEPKKPAPPARPTSPKKAEPSKKKYDDFIDKNKNGVDDRKEKPGK
jgi:hypothetical protein